MQYLKNQLELEKSQRSVTHDSLRYINILTYLLTYLHCGLYNTFIRHSGRKDK